MVLAAYYDGSGKTHDPNCQFITIAGFSAQTETWDAFGKGWQQVLADHGAPYFHASEAWAHMGAFDGWAPTKVSRLANKLLEFTATLRNYEDPRKTDLLGFSCTVNLADYAKAHARISGPVKEAEAFCVDWCAGHQFNRSSPAPETGYLTLYFDRSEDFLHKINRIWQQRLDGKRTWWAHYVTTIAPVENMRTTPALQLADFLAWAQNRKYSKNEPQYQQAFDIMTAHFHISSVRLEVP